MTKEEKTKELKYLMYLEGQVIKKSKSKIVGYKRELEALGNYKKREIVKRFKKEGK